MSIASDSQISSSQSNYSQKFNSVIPFKKKQPSPIPLTPNLSSTMASSKVTNLSSRSKSLPIWLRFLSLLNNVSTVCSFSLIVVTLTVYGLNVYFPKLWNQQYSKLINIQRNEHEMIAINEMLKHQIAEEAEKPNSGLVKANPNHAIFLKPAPESDLTTETKSKTPPDDPVIIEQKLTTPLAY